MACLHKFLLLLFLFCYAYSGFAQNKPVYSTKKKKAIAAFEQSEMFMMRGQIPHAIELLQNAIERDKDFAEAHLRIGSLYKDIGNVSRAHYHFNRALEILPEDRRTSGAYYALADMHFKERKYAEAQTLLETFKRIGEPDKRLVPEIDKLMRNIEFAQVAIKDTLPFRPTPLKPPLNTFQLQYFPVLTADQNTLIFTRREGVSSQYDEDIVVSRKGADGNWQKPEPISNNINTANNEGTTAISADGRMLIFTSCVGRRGYGSCDLYVSYRTGDEWSEPENLGPNINSASWESQPSLSPDGRTLYFVSDRPTGYGKRDIWVSYFENGNWTKAENLGNTINTVDDEVSPFIHANNQTLYFSSKGHPGFGGFDLFSSELTEVGWTKPVNLGFPLNNSDDQVSLYITSDGKKGYYAYEENYRTANYVSRLFEFEVPAAIQVENRSNYVQGKIYDANNKLPIGAQIELYDIVKDELVSAVNSDAVSGDYLMVLTQGSEYALYVSQPGYLFQSLSFDYSEVEDFEPINIDVFLEPLSQGVKTTLKNIFFDTDQYTLREKSKTELKKVVRFLKENKTVRVGIGGHTDDVGSDAYNQELSLHRAKAVYEYLLEQGVSKQQMMYRGFGKTQPLVPNDSEENRQTNRRIDFTILGM